MGGAILFVCALAAAMIVGTFVFAYASHCFFTVVEHTAAGNDEVVWPGGPFFDWLWEAVYILWLVGLWLGPVALIVRIAGGRSSILFAAAALVWMLFPISLLSTMSASSRWVVLSPRLVARLLGQRFESLGLFYLHSGPILAASAALLYLTFFRTGGLLFLPMAAVGLAAGLLIYARQIGRLAHLVQYTRDRSAISARRQPRRLTQVRAAARDPWTTETNRPRQPSELPPVMTPFDGPITGYDLRLDDRLAPEAPASPSKRPVDLDDVPYELQGSPNAPPPRGPMPKQWTEPSEYEIALARGGKAPEPPANPWAIGIYTFPLYQRSLPHLAALTGGLMFLGLLIQMMIEFRPE
jgi:hypothetical protein